jgi:hypothetical protein
MQSSSDLIGRAASHPSVRWRAMIRHPLLRLMLDAHPELTTPPETGLLGLAALGCQAIGASERP